MMAKINERSMLRVGGFALVVVGVSYLMGALLSVVIGPAPDDAINYLNALGAHPIASVANFAFFTLADICLIPAALGMYFAFKGVQRKTVIIGGALMVLFALFDSFVTELASFRLLVISRDFLNVASDVQRAEVMSSADALLAILPLSTMISFIISSLGLLMLALAMLRGSYDKRIVAPGLFAGVAGTLAGFYTLLPVLSILMVPSIFAMGLWGVLSGLRLKDKL